jgi:hypothetical protein
MLGLPDGIFSNQKFRFGSILEGLAMEDVDMLFGHLVYFTAIWYIVWPFDIWYEYLVFFPILVCWTMNNLATLKYVQFYSIRLDPKDEGHRFHASHSLN